MWSLKDDLVVVESDDEYESDDSDEEEDVVIVSDSEGLDSTPDRFNRSDRSLSPGVDRHAAAIAAVFLNTSNSRLKSRQSHDNVNKQTNSSTTKTFNGANKTASRSLPSNSFSCGDNISSQLATKRATGSLSPYLSVISKNIRSQCLTDNQANILLTEFQNPADVIYDELKGCIDGLNDTLLQRRSDLTLMNLADAADVSLLSDISFASEDLTVGLSSPVPADETLPYTVADADPAAKNLSTETSVVFTDNQTLTSDSNLTSARVCLNLQNIFGKAVDDQEPFESALTSTEAQNCQQFPGNIDRTNAFGNSLINLDNAMNLSKTPVAISKVPLDIYPGFCEAGNIHLSQFTLPIGVPEILPAVSTVDSSMEVLCLPVQIDSNAIHGVMPPVGCYQPCLPVSIPVFDLNPSVAESFPIDVGPMSCLRSSANNIDSCIKVGDALDDHYFVPYSAPYSMFVTETKPFPVEFDCSSIGNNGYPAPSAGLSSNDENKSNMDLRLAGSSGNVETASDLNDVAPLWVTFPSWLSSSGSLSKLTEVDMNSNNVLSDSIVAATDPNINTISCKSQDVATVAAVATADAVITDAVKLPSFTEPHASSINLHRGQKRIAFDDPNEETLECWSTNQKRQRTDQNFLHTTTSLNSSVCDELVLKCSIDCLPTDGLNTTIISDILGDSGNQLDVVDICQPPATGKCAVCLSTTLKASLAHCTHQHACCGSCLQGQVKELLMDNVKNSFRCLFPGCNSFYLLSQLHNALPKMIVDILEEKLEREYCVSAVSLLMHVNKPADVTTLDVDIDDCAKQPVPNTVNDCGRLSTNIKDDDSSDVDSDSDTDADKNMKLKLETEHVDSVSPVIAALLPGHWSPVDTSQDYSVVTVDENSAEFDAVNKQFHETLDKTQSLIVRLERLQNPVLWQFYAMKKKQMEFDDSLTAETAEKMLFHGVKWRYIDTICRNNIDWRTCGVSHGVMYGEGTYFARDASYAHEYTDAKSSPSKSDLLVVSSESSLNDNDTNAADGNTEASTCSVADTQTDKMPPSEDKNLSAVDSAESCGSIRCMFLCRVLVGQFTVGRRTYRKPPPLDPDAPFSKSFDSCVNYLDEPTLFVLFDNTQFYPEYLIYYSHKMLSHV